MAALDKTYRAKLRKNRPGGRWLRCSVLTSLFLGAFACAGIGERRDEPLASAHSTAPPPVESSSTITFTSAPGGGSVHSAMHAFWAKLDATWKARDLDGFVGLFADKATFHVISREELVEGREEIRARFAEQFSRQSRDLRHVTTLRRVEHLGSGLAAVDAQVRVLRVALDDSADPAVLRTFAVFAIMTRSSEAWVIRDVRIYTLAEPTSESPPAQTDN